MKAVRRGWLLKITLHSSAAMAFDGVLGVWCWSFSTDIPNDGKGTRTIAQGRYRH